MVEVWVPGLPSLSHNTLDYLPRPLYRGFPCRTLNNDIFFQVDSLSHPSTISNKPKNKKTLKLFPGDKKNFFRDHHHLSLLFQLHKLAAAMKGSISTSGHNKFCPAFLTNISLPNLIRHLMCLLSKNQRPLMIFKVSHIPRGVSSSGPYPSGYGVEHQQIPRTWVV